jgi:hypothetical protein
MARKKTGHRKVKTSKVKVSGKHIQGGMQNPSSMFSYGSAKLGIDKVGADVQQTSSFFYSPELTTESWLLPKSRQEILKWARIFFNLEPYVQSIITMHSLYPFSKFEISTEDESVTQFYKDMAFNENFDLFEFILKASLSYQKFGEALPFGNMVKGKDGKYRWSRFVLLEPELVEVSTDMFEGTQAFSLIPTDELKKLVKSTDEADMKRLEQLREKAPAIVDAIEKNKNIDMSEDHVSLIANLTDPSATRGTSPIQCLFKVLIYQDWIRLAQSAFAQRYIFPIELWKLGDAAQGIIPDDKAITDFRNMINQAIQNPPFTIIYPDIVKYEAVSTLGKQFPINNEYEYIHDQLLVGMGVNKNIILGEGPSFSNVKTMALHKLMMVYKVVRDKFENWMINKYFRPIAIKNKFYTTSGGTRKLILPTISWNKSLDIEEEQDEKERFIDFHAKGLISTKTLFDKFPNINYEDEQKNLEDEMGTIFDKGDERLPKDAPKKSKGKGGGGAAGGDLPELDLPMPEAPAEPGEAGEEAPETPGEAPVPEAPGGEAPAAPEAPAAE